MSLRSARYSASFLLRGARTSVVEDETKGSLRCAGRSGLRMWEGEGVGARWDLVVIGAIMQSKEGDGE